MSDSQFCCALSVLFAAVVLLAAAGGSPRSRASAADTPATRPALSDLEVQLVFPGSRWQGEAETVARPPAGCELVRLRAADGVKLAGLFGKASAPNAAGARPTLLFFYGNAMCMADSVDIFDRFRGMGFNAMLVDYEGYGMSEGKPSEPGCCAAADAAYDYVLTRKEADPKRIVSTGWSVGAAVAIDLAARRRVAGLVTFSAFTNTQHMADRATQAGIPVKVVLVSKFDNLAKIAKVPCPILMARGTDDPLVPIDMLDSLIKAAKTKPATLRLDGAAHNDLFLRGGDELYGRVKKFVDGLPDAPADDGAGDDAAIASLLPSAGQAPSPLFASNT